MIYVYAKADQMIGHNFTDDVAIVRAFNKKCAYNKFKELYADVHINDIQRIKIKYKSVTILTDY